MKRLVIIPSRDGAMYDLRLLSPNKKEKEIIDEVHKVVFGVKERLGEDVDGVTAQEIIQELETKGYTNLADRTIRGAANPYYD